MKFIHTADWHLGKKLFGHSMLEDQAHALDELERLCVDEQAQALVIAGDIYDRSVPPLDAVSLLDDFFERMARRAKIPVIAISGNHDGPERLGFGGRLFEQSGIHMRTRFEDRMRPVVIEHGGERTAFFTLPYLEPDVARTTLGDDSLRSHHAAVERSLENLPDEWDRRVLVAHLFCVGGQESPESERPLSVGGAEHVHPQVFTGFDYVALGHLHRPQRVAGREHYRYSGSLLKYSVDEHAHKKSVTIVELGAATEPAALVVREQPLSLKRDVVHVVGSFDELMESPDLEEHQGDYVAASYTDATYVLHAADRLRERFPFLLQALPERVRAVVAEDSTGARRSDTPAELLQSFWDYVGMDHDLEPEHLQAFENAWSAAQRGDEGDSELGAKRGNDTRPDAAPTKNVDSTDAEESRA